MLFNSVAFLVFLPCVYLVYWALSRRAQNVLLVAASYLFYGWWDWRFLGLIVLSSAVDYAAGLGIDRSSGLGRRRAWLGLSLLTNLGLLGTFKYLGFGVASLAALLESLGFEPHLPVLELILPVGISFYTFQTLSYTLDVYWGRLPPTRDPVAFFAFVAFFPQLVAGPIERASHLLGQLERPRSFDPAAAACGARRILWGLFLKTVVADNLAPLVDRAYAAPAEADPWQLVHATWLFAFQIYGDFAGYSEIAIGTAALFGIHLRRNFAWPYFSASPAEFWRRWHISLSTWFRDYVYVPLGGSRQGEVRRRLNVLATFVLSGLWHGAALTFVVWGLLHGLVVALQRRPGRTVLETPGGARPWRAIPAVVATFLVVDLAWVFFRARDLGDAAVVLDKVCLQAWRLPPLLPDLRLTALVGVLLAVEWLQRGRAHGLDVGHLPRPLRHAACLAVALAVLLLGQVEAVPFIYFQF